MLLIQGDTHQYLSDRPLKDAKGKPLSQLVRLVVPGESQADAVLIRVDTADRASPFHFKLLRAEIQP